jgi:2-dehydro-3-deoxy-D-arabinonate dehydratase
MAEEMFLLHYAVGVEHRLGVQVGDTVYSLGNSLPSLEWLLANVPAGELLDVINRAKAEPVAASDSRLLFGQQEVWAAGVTYKQSEEARERESSNSTIYTRVYSAQRPEIFMKAIGYHVVSSGDEVGIRYDATWSVPEPELAVVLNARMEVVGFTVGNDMSSRDIEGENPLYLPQAKVYDRSCALGPRIWLRPGVTEWPQVDIAITIERDGASVFSGETSSAQLHRTLADLVGYLGRAKRFEHGAVLLTGTGIVPPDEFTLEANDVVTITIDPIGTLQNRVSVVGPMS